MRKSKWLVLLMLLCSVLLVTFVSCGDDNNTGDNSETSKDDYEESQQVVEIDPNGSGEHRASNSEQDSSVTTTQDDYEEHQEVIEIDPDVGGEHRASNNGN